MNIIILFFTFLFLFLYLITKYNIEGFRERLGYQYSVRDIARCPTYKCLQEKEDNCHNWCSENVINSKV